jgi:hypothetical protein
MTSDDKAKRRRHFYIKRQQFIDEIIFDHGSKAVPALTAFERNVAIMIAKSESPDTGETFESYSSIAKRLGGKTKVRHVESAAKVLEARDWLHIEQRGSRVYLSIRVKGLHGHRSTKLPEKSYEARHRQITRALECSELSHAERQTYIGITSISDKVGGWSEGQREAAAILGMPWTTFRRCVQSLQTRALLHVDAEIIIALPMVTLITDRNGGLIEEPLDHHWSMPGPEVVHGQSDFPEKSMGSPPTPVTPGTPVTPIPSPSDSAPSPAATERTDPLVAKEGGKVMFTSEGRERFRQLVALIHDNSSGDRNHKTGAGIIAVSGGPGHFAGGEVGDEVYGYPYDWAELQKFAKAGLLIRRGDRYYISTLGWQAYNWIEQQSQKEAA